MKKYLTLTAIIISFIIMVFVFASLYENSQTLDSLDHQWGFYNYGQEIEGVEGTSGNDIGMGSNYMSYPGENVIIAIFDTGVDFDNPCLSGTQYVNHSEIPNNGIDDDHNGYIDDISGWDFIHNDSSQFDQDNQDGNYHGSQIASIISVSDGCEINSVLSNVQILSLKIADGNAISVQEVIRAIEYAESLGARIVNMSFSLSSYNQDLFNAMSESDMLFVCAAGNFSTSDLSYPAAYSLDNVISVGAFNNNGYKSISSNYGDYVDLFAPGENIYTISSTGFEYASGTSYSAAFITAACAYISSNLSLNYEGISIEDVLIINARINHRLSEFSDTMYCLDMRMIKEFFES